MPDGKFRDNMLTLKHCNSGHFGGWPAIRIVPQAPLSMLPRGDGAGQHLCEGDLGYKTKQNKPVLDYFSSQDDLIRGRKIIIFFLII